MATAVDASSPALVGTSTPGTITTASFTAPANSILVACCWSSVSLNSQTFTVTDSGGLTWTLAKIQNSAGTGGKQGVAAIYYAVAPTSAARTVTAVISGGNYSTLKVYAITGGDLVTPIGGSAAGSSTSTSFSTTGYTIQTTGSIALTCVSNTTGGATITSSGSTTVTSTATGHNGLSGYKTNGTAGGSSTSPITCTGTPAINWVTVEIRAGSTSTTVNEAGSSTPTGSVAGKQTTKATLTGSSTPGATVSTRTTVKAKQTGSSTPTGAVTKATTKAARTGSSTPSGVATPLRVVLLTTKSGSSSPSGAILPRTTTKQAPGSSTPTGLLRKNVTKTNRTGSSTPTGTPNTPVRLQYRPQFGTVTPAGSVAGKQVVRKLAGTSTPTGLLKPKTTTYLLKGSLQPTGHITTLRLPATGTRIAPAKALPALPIVGSMVTWEEYLPPGCTAEVFTSLDNHTTWDRATNGRPVPNLLERAAEVTAVSTKVVLTRPAGVFDLPWIDKLDIDFDLDDTVIEWIPAGVFTLDDSEVSDDENGIVVTLTGRDISALVQDAAWEGIFTQPANANLGDVIKAVISDRQPGAQFNFCSVDAVAPKTLTFGANDTNNPLQDCADCAQVAGTELYVDVHGVWTMNPQPDPEVGNPVRTLTDRARAVMKKIRRKLTKSDTRNYIVVAGTSSANTTAARGVAFDDDPTSLFNIFGGLGKRVLRITSKLVSDDAAALVMAKAELLKRKNLTETVSVTLISDPSLQESDIVALDRSVSKLAGNALIDAMEIPFDVETDMTLEARKQRLLASGQVGSGVGGLNGDDGGSDSGGADASSFTVAFGACINGADSGAFTYIRDANPDYFAILGDVWYKDGAAHTWSADWSAKFAATNYAAMLAGLPNPQIVGWSDHDFGYENNATGGDVGSSHVNAANAAYRTSFPNVALPASGIYRTWTRGRIRFILLDMLSFKSPLNATDNSSKTMLGSTQKSWYKGLLADSTFPLIVVFGDSQIPGPKENGQDEWRGYSTERAEMQSALNASPATVLYLNGDSHSLGYGHDQYGYDRIWQSAPFHNTTKVKAGGEGYIETYPTNADESDTEISELYAIATFTDSGDSIQADCRFFEASDLKFTDSITIDAPGGSGGGSQNPSANIGALLKIGSTSGYNHFNVGIGMSAGSHIDHTQSEIANGLVVAGYFELTGDGLRAKLSDHLDGGTTSSGTQYPRVEFRELEQDGTTKSAWDPDANGYHYVKAKGRVTKVPPNKPQVVLLQFHDADDDTATIRIEGGSAYATLGDSKVATLGSFSLNTDYYYMLRVEGDGSKSVIKYYWGTTEAALSTPAYTSSSVGRSSGWYCKAGNYGQSNSSIDSVSNGPFIVEMSKLECSRTGYPTPVGWS